MNNFFNKNHSNAYDEQNEKLAPISNNMHFLIRLVLEELPADARILCIGIGTGAEIFSLAENHPGWSFVGVDPSRDMLDVCKTKLDEAGIADRCELIEGYIEDAPNEEFDAVLSVLVGHFVRKEDRPSFYKGMYDCLKTGGYMVSTELSFDLDSAEYPAMLKNWEQVQLVRGATPESIQNLPSQLKETLTVLSPTDTEEIMRESGFTVPVRFFQSFMMMGWYGKKD